MGMGGSHKRAGVNTTENKHIGKKKSKSLVKLTGKNGFIAQSVCCYWLVGFVKVAHL